MYLPPPLPTRGYEAAEAQLISQAQLSHCTLSSSTARFT